MERYIPVLIGCASLTKMPARGAVGSTPADLLALAAGSAIRDTLSPSVVAAIDLIAVMRLFSETSPRFRSQLGAYSNLPRSVARRLGLSPRREIYAQSGGNMPQFMVNSIAGEVARGETRAALIVGGEALASQRAGERSLPPGSWEEDAGGHPEEVGDVRSAYSEHEALNGVAAAIVGYPLIENVIRAKRGRSVDAHMATMGSLLEPLANIARANPLATRRHGYSASDIAATGPDNPMIGFPYTKLMNSNAYVDQAAALIMTSTDCARECGVPEEKWIYLHGHADVDDIWYFTERPQLDRSQAIQLGARHALEMAGRNLSEIDCFDLYSCFPSAIEIAREAIGIAPEDSRPLSITGGLPFHGGPGNSYTMCSIAQMMTRLRERPGSFGMVTGNGNVLTKHSFGVYSTIPHSFHEIAANRALQAEVDAAPRMSLDFTPTGLGEVESYTIVHSAGAPVEGVVLGRTASEGHRFIAKLPSSAALLHKVMAGDFLGTTGTVTTAEGSNEFVPAFA